MGGTVELEEQAGTPSSAVIGQRVAITGATKLGSHVALAMLDDGRARQRAVATALVSSDLLYLGWLRRQGNAPRMVVRSGLDCVEATILTLVGARSDATARPITISTSVPTAIEYGYRTALATSDGRVRAALLGMCASGAPIAAACMTSYLTGRRPRPGQVGWTIMGFTAGAAIGAIRERAHRSARQLWKDRLASQIVSETAQARARVSMPTSPGHNLAPMLRILTEAGSMEAADAWRSMDDRKAAIASDPTGNTLFHACFSQPVRPDDLGFLWLTNRQISSLHRFIDAADTAPRDITQDHIEIRLLGPSERRNVVTLLEAEVEVSYLGHTTVLAAMPSWVRGQRLGVIVDGAPAAFLGAAAWKLSTTAPSTMASLPMWFVAPAVLADALGMLLHWRIAHDEARHDGIVVGWSLAAAAAFCLTAPQVQRRFEMPDGSALCPATAGSLGAAVLLGNYWPRAGHWRWPALLVLSVLPVAGLHPSLRSRRRSLWELSFTLMAFGAAIGLQRRADDERAMLVDEELAKYVEQMRRATFASAREELDWFAKNARIVRLEASRLRRQLDGLTPGLVAAALQTEQWVRRERRAMERRRPRGF